MFLDVFSISLLDCLIYLLICMIWCFLYRYLLLLQLLWLLVL